MIDFTPGSWKVREIPGGHIINMGACRVVTWKHGLDPIKDREQWLEADANIRLMAKAPELLKSAEEMLRYFDFGRPIRDDLQYSFIKKVDQINESKWDILTP